eukprot:COSAG02_NODE_2030_length_10067_cov_22.885333_4_plen_87_part_00
MTSTVTFGALSVYVCVSSCKWASRLCTHVKQVSKYILRVSFRLRDRSPVPIAAGENESGRLEFSPWIERRALDYYQVDLGVKIRKR